MSNSLLIVGASQILTLRGRGPRRGKALSNLGVIDDGALLIRDGRIVAVGVRAKVEALPEARTADNLFVGGRVVLPGFVDSHTHLVHAASRAEEYELKIAGASYEEIARKGGGILNSVKKLRAATSEALKKRALSALREFAANGTTTLEAKSGYGLDVTSELKILNLHQELLQEQPLEIVSTFLGAHVVPTEYRGTPGGPQRYVSMLIHRLIPEVAERKLAEFCDVFCDRGAFSRAQSEQVLEAGEQHGLAPRIHAEQLTRTGAAQLGMQLGAASCDHLEQVNHADIRALGEVENGGDTDARVRFSPGTEAVRARPQPHRRRRDCFTRDRLQSRDQPYTEHADDSIAGVHATADDAGGGDCGGYHQWSVRAAPRQRRWISGGR